MLIDHVCDYCDNIVVVSGHCDSGNVGKAAVASTLLFAKLRKCNTNCKYHLIYNQADSVHNLVAKTLNKRLLFFSFFGYPDLTYFGRKI